MTPLSLTPLDERWASHDVVLLDHSSRRWGRREMDGLPYRANTPSRRREYWSERSSFNDSEVYSQNYLQIGIDHSRRLASIAGKRHKGAVCVRGAVAKGVAFIEKQRSVSVRQWVNQSCALTPSQWFFINVNIDAINVAHVTADVSTMTCDDCQSFGKARRGLKILALKTTNNEIKSMPTCHSYLFS